MVKHYSVDLSKNNTSFFKDYINKNQNIAGVCFSQRYRENGDILENYEKAQKEFNISILHTGSFIDLLLNDMKKNRLENKEEKHCSIVIIGSVYATSIGFDQRWEYHIAKTAQQALVRYFSAIGGRNISINTIDPPTFKKTSDNHSKEFMTKLDNWSKLPAKDLNKHEDIAEICVDLLTCKNNMISGNNIRLDYGTGFIYPDQIFKINNS